MKTAKEACEEIEKAKIEKLNSKINTVVSYLVHYGGTWTVTPDMYAYPDEETISKLEELGYKVERCIRKYP